MAKGKPRDLVEVQCPCCQATLKIDPETRAVISHQEPVKPRVVEDLTAAVTRLKGEAQRREDAFQKSLAAERSHEKVLERKFEELLRKAKENPDEPPPLRDIDWD
jgi:hypothetical protein